MFGGIILFLLGVAVFAIIVYFVVKLAVRTAILEARRMGDVHGDAAQRALIRRAVIEALQESEYQKNINEV